MTEKLAVGKQMGGFMQHRQRTRPLRVETLLAREDDRSPSSVFQPGEKYEKLLAKDESPEFAEEPVKEGSEKLYHYGPKDVDLTVEGLKTPHTLDDPKSTAHYISRVSQATGKPESGVTREDVLKWLESSRGPGGSRMVSVLHKPLGDDATAAQKNFASRGQLYEIDYDSARKNKLIELAQIVEERPKVQRTVRRRDLPQALREAKGYPANHPRMAFKGTPHGFVAVKGGTLPGEYLRKVGVELKPKQSEFAPGIQRERKIEGIPRVSEKAANQEWMVSLSKHPAARRGDHRDLRLVDPQGKGHSWAFNELPEPGKGTYAAQQPTHGRRYSLRKKPFTIPLNVYGGTRPGAKVEPEYVQPAEVISASNDRVHLLRHHGQETEELILKKVSTPPRGSPLWSLRNATKNRATKEGKLIPNDKPRYKEIDPDLIDLSDDQQVMSPKIDGAHGLVSFPKKGRMVRVYSYRPTQRKSGLIEHTFKFPNYQNRKTPKSLQGSLIRAEIYATDKSGKAIPASEIGGLLNSSVPKARRLQQSENISLHLAGLDVVRHKGKNYSNKSFNDKLEVLRDVSRGTGGLVEELPVARTPAEKKKLLSQIKSGKYPKTREGVVLHELNTNGPPTKAKIRPSHNVYVRGVFTKGSTPKGQAGGFTYAFSPDGPVAGKVGTGLSRQMRQDMASNPEKFIGRVAKVRSAGRHQKRKDKTQGALVGSPAFKEWHIDKTPPELMKEGAGELYHGSPQRLTKLEPRREHGDPKVPDAVFGTPMRTFALAYAGDKWGDRDINQGVWYDKDDNPKEMYLREMRPGALDDIYKGRKGYMYKLPSEGFELPPRMGARWEQLNRSTVTPLETEEIEDVMAALEADPLAKVYPYDPKDPQTRRAIKHSISRMGEMDPKSAKQYKKWRLENAPPEIAKMFEEEMAATELTPVDKTPPELLKEGAEKKPESFTSKLLSPFSGLNTAPQEAAKQLQEYVKKERRVKAMMRLKSEVGKLRADWGGTDGSH